MIEYIVSSILKTGDDMHTFLLTFLTFLLFTLTGCGGGGGGSSTATASSPTSQGTVAVTQGAVEPSSTAPSSQDKIKVTDSSAVEGLTVLCDGTKLITDANGEFECDTLPFSIFLGEYKLAEIEKLPTDRVIYTQDIIHVPRGAIDYPEVTKVSMILQTLDDDADPFNGITLKISTIELLNEQLSQSDKLEDFTIDDVKSMLQGIIATSKQDDVNSKLQLINAKEAQINLTTITAKIPEGVTK